MHKISRYLAAYVELIFAVESSVRRKAAQCWMGPTCQSHGDGKQIQNVLDLPLTQNKSGEHERRHV